MRGGISVPEKGVVKKEEEDDCMEGAFRASPGFVEAGTGRRLHECCSSSMTSVRPGTVISRKVATAPIPSPSPHTSFPLKNSPLELSGARNSLEQVKKKMKRSVWNDEMLENASTYRTMLLEERVMHKLEMDAMKKKLRGFNEMAKEAAAAMKTHDKLIEELSSLEKERDELKEQQTHLSLETDKLRTKNRALVSEQKKRERGDKWNEKRREKRREEKVRELKKRVSCAGASDWKTRKRRREELDEYLNSIVAEGDEQEKLEEKLDLVMAWAQGKKVCLERKDKEQSSGETV